MSTKRVYLQQLPAQFDYNLLLEQLSSYSKPRDKIRELLKVGEIVRVKKGLYVLGEMYHKPYSRIILANQIYGPSYVSMHSALSYWNAIPERVELIQSVTSKRNKFFNTPVGDFQYYYSRMEIYQVGYTLQLIDGQNKALIATKEKALSDLVARLTNVKVIEDVEVFLEGMRLDREFLAELSTTELGQIAKSYRTKSVSLLLEYIEKI